MKIITATEMLTKKSIERNKLELEELMQIILLENSEEYFESRIWIDEQFNCLCLNVDEITFNLNGTSLENWLQKNTDCNIKSDKEWRVFGIHRNKH